LPPPFPASLRRSVGGALGLPGPVDPKKGATGDLSDPRLSAGLDSQIDSSSLGGTLLLQSLPHRSRIGLNVGLAKVVLQRSRL